MELTPVMEGLFYIQQPINVTTLKLVELKKKKKKPCKVHLNACSIIICGEGVGKQLTHLHDVMMKTLNKLGREKTF